MEVELRQQREDNLRQREDILALRSAFEEEKGKAVQLRSNSEVQSREIEFLKRQMELLFANSTVKDLAFSQLNTQHGALDETCTDIRTDVDRLDSTSQSLIHEVTALGRRSHRQENDVNQLANRMEDIQDGQRMLADNAYPETVAVTADDGSDGEVMEEEN